jgi:5-methyltetrahydropteroyltriglutamate--homocysteine methyltransferase
MQPSPRHPVAPDFSFDGGSLDCGSGLLLLIRKHLDPLRPGQLMEVRSTETSVEEDLPAWCRLTGNALVSWTREGANRAFLIRKKGEDAVAPGSAGASPSRAVIAPLSVMGAAGVAADGAA